MPTLNPLLELNKQKSNCADGFSEIDPTVIHPVSLLVNAITPETMLPLFAAKFLIS